MTALQKRLLFLVGLLLVLQSGVLLVQYLGEIREQGSRFGGDFVSFWNAARHAYAGEWGRVYDPDHWRQILAGSGEVELGWFVYPPFLLLGLQPLGALTYEAAVFWWSVIPAAIYFGLVWSVARRAGLPPLGRVLAMVLTFPFLTANLFTGQTGTIVAVLFLGAALFVPTRPVLAGVCIGLIAMKPQLGFLLPFALAAAGQWRAFASAAITVVVLVVASLLWFGPAMWADYLAMLQLFGSLVGQGYEGVRPLVLGPYVSLLAGGYPLLIAAAVQALLSVAMVVVVMVKFRRGEGSFGLIAVATLIATPYALTYDMPVLALAVVPLLGGAWRDGLGPTSLAALIAVIVVPFVPESLIDAGVPFGTLSLLLALTAILQSRGAEENGSPGLIRTGDHSINSRTLYR